jgi:hypothetical protein
MGEEGKVCKMLVGKPEGKRDGSYGDWLGSVEWIQLAHDRDR